MTVTARRWLGGIAVVIVALVVYGASPVAQTTDSFWVTYTAVSLLDDGDVALDEYPEALRRAEGFQVEQVDGRSVYEVPVATSLIATPAVAVVLALDGDGLRAELERGDPPSIDRWLGSLLAALAVGVVYGTALDATRRVGVGVAAAAVFGFATAAWSTASRGMWMNTPSMLAVAVTVLLAQRLQAGRGRTATALLLGVVLAVAVAIRPTNAVLAAAVLAWVLVRHRNRAIPLVLAGAVGGSTAMASNAVLVGAALPRYVRGGRLELTSLFPEAVLGNLVSPARGLLVYSPVLVLGVVGVVLRRRADEPGDLEVVFGGVLGLHLVVVSLFPHWWGGWSYGPRFMVDVLPLATWFLLPVLAVCLDRSRQGAGTVALRVSLVALVATSVWINARGAIAPGTFAWNREPVSVDADPERVWDWSDPPFLR